MSRPNNKVRIRTYEGTGGFIKSWHTSTIMRTLLNIIIQHT